MLVVAAIEVRRAEVEDIDAIAMVLGAAFADYPWTRWTIDADDHERRIVELQRSALEHLGLPHGEVWVATVDDAVACAAIWMDSAVRIPRAALASVGADRIHLEGDRHEASLRADAETAPLIPPEPHRYLATIGTAPEHRHQGLATATLRPPLEGLDASASLGFLMTSWEPNVAFYQGQGFTVSGHLDLSGGGPPVWAMTRHPSPPELSPAIVRAG